MAWSAWETAATLEGETPKRAREGAVIWEAVWVTWGAWPTEVCSVGARLRVAWGGTRAAWGAIPLTRSGSTDKRNLGGELLNKGIF